MNSKQKTTIYVMLILLLVILFIILVMASGADPDNTSQATIGPANTNTTIPATSTPTNTSTHTSTPTLTLTPTSTASPTLTSTPTLEPSVIITNDTQCYSGPGPPYTLVGWLLNGTSVELVGKGEFRNWYIVNHPIISGVTCWVPISDLALEGINLDTYSFWEAPPLPIATPTVQCWTATPEPLPDVLEPAANSFSDSWLLHPTCGYIPTP
ncbi:MAG: hypothetical protein FVQ83_03415 [Chloroflexi bacterium]|nr:hypothetical protein [Chloroflexota bacterium]